MIGPLSPDPEIQSLIDLISNTTEAYTTALFLAPGPDRDLTLFAYQSLSKNIETQVKIGPGEGLVGWVHKSKEPVNVDQFDSDTRRLLFYREDESIKSFMAVPLKKAHGVLAVDSKQRYVFTDKSHKILHQFAQTLEMALERLSESDQGQKMAGALSFMSEIEKAFAKNRKPTQSLPKVLSIIKEYAGASACFLTAVLPRDPGFYYIMSSDAPQGLKLREEIMPLESGLAGWVQQNGKSLILERPRSESERSYVFYPDEPLKSLPGFAGFPVFYAERLRGAILLAGREPLKLEQTRIQGLETAAGRLAAFMEIEVLLQRVNELGRLDPQVGLPHRTFFTKRVNRLLKMVSVKRAVLSLLIVKITNLDQLASQLGQETAQEILRNSARLLLENTLEDQELGHLSYGILGVALVENSDQDALRTASDLAAILTDRPLETSKGHVQLETETAVVHSPSAEAGAEDLIWYGLARLEDQKRSIPRK